MPQLFLTKKKTSTKNVPIFFEWHEVWKELNVRVLSATECHVWSLCFSDSRTVWMKYSPMCISIHFTTCNGRPVELPGKTVGQLGKKKRKQPLAQKSWLFFIFLLVDS